MATIANINITTTVTGVGVAAAQLNTLDKVLGRVQRSIIAFAGVLVARQIVTGFASVVKGAGDMSRALADIERTSGLTGNELTGLRGDLIQLSTVMAGTVDDFLQVAVTAGRAGVTTREEIGAIAVVAAQFGKISKVSFEQASNDLIRLSRTFGAVDIRENILEISDAILLTATKFAVTSKEIIEATQRAGASIAALNLPVAETVVLLAAVTERIGKARKAGTEFNSAIFQAGANLDKFAFVAGITETKVRELIDDDALGALTGLLSSIRDSTSSAVERMNILSDIFGKVGTKALAPLIPQLFELITTMDEVSTAVEKGGITAAQYAIVMKSTGEQMKLVGATTGAISKIFGLQLEPSIRLVTGSLLNLLKATLLNQSSFGEVFSDAINGITTLFRLLNLAIVTVNGTLDSLKSVTESGIVKTWNKLTSIGQKLREKFKQIIDESFKTAVANQQATKAANARTKSIEELIIAMQKQFQVGGALADQDTAVKTTQLELDTAAADAQSIQALADLRIALDNTVFENQIRQTQARNDALSFYLENLKNGTLSVAAIFQSITQQFQTEISGVFKQLIRGTLDAKEAFKELGLKMVDVVIDYIAQLVVAHTIGSALSKAATAETLAQAAIISVAWIIPAILATIATLGKSVGIAFSAIGKVGAFAANFASGLGGIIGLEHGGIVTKPTVALIGEAGPEAIIPLKKAGQMGGNITINITEPIFLDDESSKDRFVRRIQDAIIRTSNRQSAGTNIVL